MGLSSVQQIKFAPFELKDQFGREYTERDFSGHVVVLLGSDKDGSTFNPIWASAIHDSLKGDHAFDALRFVGVSDLRGVPFFLKGFVRGKFPKEKEKWVLLDWKGTLPQAYGFEEKKCNILIFERNGDLVYRTSVRELAVEKLRHILAEIRPLLAGKNE